MRVNTVYELTRPDVVELDVSHLNVPWALFGVLAFLPSVPSRRDRDVKIFGPLTRLSRIWLLRYPENTMGICLLQGF